MKETAVKRVSTGVPGLDEVLHGGLLPRRAYLVRGGPGTGKTILGLHFLVAGEKAGEPVLFVSMSEPENELKADAADLGLDVSAVSFLDLSPSAEFFAESQSYDIFSPAEVERAPITEKLVERVEQLHPTRVFVDAITQMRYLATDEQQFRKEALSFLRFLTDAGATVLFTSEYGPLAPDEDLQFLSDGIIQLDNSPQGRTVNVLKFRGSDFRHGAHAMRLTNAGMEVFPRLLPGAHGRAFSKEAIPSGIPALDALLHGGLERGTVTLITGPIGVGKTTLGMQFANEAATRGERTVIYLFEEAAETVIHRSEGIGVPIQQMIEQGTLVLRPVEALAMTGDEFANEVRREVEEKNARIVLIDSVAGYRLSLRGQDLVGQLHALTRYLRNMGVTTLLVNETEYVTGEFRATELGISFLADNVIFMRYVELDGALRKTIGVLKKRVSDFEKTMRRFDITGQGIVVGEPLTGLRGILRGVPEWESVKPGEGR